MSERDELRLFIREMVTRLERVLRDQTQMFERLEARLDVQSRALQTTIEENREEHRAQREALFRILDRLQNGGAQA